MHSLMWLGLQTVSSLERCPLFRVPFIERFHCIQGGPNQGNLIAILSLACVSFCVVSATLVLCIHSTP